MQSENFAGRYHILTQLAEGGMGVTYRAWDDEGQRPVVIKMPKRPRDDPDGKKLAEVVARFNREIVAMKSVGEHPGVVPVIDSGEENGLPFIVMRLLPGGSLADRRKAEANSQYRPLPPTQLRSWLPVVASALDHIHSRAMIHRDVKPSNIFFDAFELAYLGDFGIAKPVDPSGATTGQTVTATHASIGTPEYMAPELTRQGKRLSGAVDQYALAVTVYGILAGRPPFTGLADYHVIVEHAIKTVPPLDGILPSSLRLAVERGLAKKPEDRFRNCTEFAEAVLADVPFLDQNEAAFNKHMVARLLCPNHKCRKLLKMRDTEAGKRGSCPSCHALVEIAGDLSALWLQSEVDSIPCEKSSPPKGKFFEAFNFDEWSRNGSELGEVDSDLADFLEKKSILSVRRLLASFAIPLLEWIGPLVLAGCVVLAAVVAAVRMAPLIGREPPAKESGSGIENPDGGPIAGPPPKPPSQEGSPHQDPIVGSWDWKVDDSEPSTVEFLNNGDIKLNGEYQENCSWKNLAHVDGCSFYAVCWRIKNGSFIDALELKNNPEASRTLEGYNHLGIKIVGKPKEASKKPD